MFKVLREKLSGWFGPKEKVSKERAESEKEKLEKESKQKKSKKGVAEARQKENSKKPAIQERAEELERKLEKDISDKTKEKEELFEKAHIEEEVEEKKGFFGKLAEKLTKSELSEKDFNELFEQFEFTLLENNVALGVVDKIRSSLGEGLVGKKFSRKDVKNKILEALKKSVDGVLMEGGDLIERIKSKDKSDPFVILFFGINGSGKTTSIAKMAYLLKEKNVSCVVAAGDTFRAASIEQLEKHANKIGIGIIKGEYGKDPASVAFDAIAYAKKNKIKVVLIDTAGRMYTKTNLMREMEKIVRVSKPDLKIFVGESITGNDAVEQARMFHESAGIDGIILTKADVDEKAGVVLSVSHVTGKPIYFLGVGQGYKALEIFSKKNILKSLGLGN